MWKGFLLTACVLVAFGLTGCGMRHRNDDVMSLPKPTSSAAYHRPASPSPTLSVSNAGSAAAAKSTAIPAPASSASRKGAAATASNLSSSAAYHLKAGDPIVVCLRGIPGVAGGEQQIEDIIDENGVINLSYIGAIQAGGKTSTELEQTIQKAYLDQKIYRYLTVNVMAPSRSYYVRGEIKQPGRFQLLSRVTVVQAIAAAGGFTEFANPSKVEILRGNQRIRINAAEFEKHPERDKEIESGDVIIVQRSFF